MARWHIPVVLWAWAPALLGLACASEAPPGDELDGGDAGSVAALDGALLDAAQSDADRPDGTRSIDGGVPSTLVRIHHDGGPGHRMTLRGDGGGLSWDEGRECVLGAGDVWSCEIAGLESAIEIKPLIDDEVWAKGTNWRVEPGTTLDIYPFFFATAGRIVTHAGFASTLLGNSRDVFVYLPPSYDENEAKRYPILVMHDGQNLFDPSLAFGGVAWEVDAAVDALATSAGIVEPIVVGVSNSSRRIYEYTRTADASYGDGGGADLYLRFLLEELLPVIRSTYRTTGERVGLAGSSLGGAVTLYGCWTRPEAFDRCGVFSPALWWDDDDLIHFVADDPATAADKPLTLYLDSGDSGTSSDGMANTIEMRDILVGKGFVLDGNLRYVLGVGHVHDEAAWAERTPGALAFLLRDPQRGS